MTLIYEQHVQGLHKIPTAADYTEACKGRTGKDKSDYDILG